MQTLIAGTATLIAARQTALHLGPILPALLHSQLGNLQFTAELYPWGPASAFGHLRSLQDSSPTPTRHDAASTSPMAALDIARRHFQKPPVLPPARTRTGQPPPRMGRAGIRR